MEKAVPASKSPFATEPIGKLITKFAVPCVVALLVNSLYNIVDQIFIGWGVGYLGNGATNVVFPITIIALALSVLIGDGGAAYLSLKLGEGDLPSVKRGVSNAVVMIIIAGIAMLVITLVFMSPILTLFGATDTLRPAALEYNEFAVKCFRIFLMLCPLNGFQTVAAIYLQAIGKPAKAAIVTLSRQIIFLVPAAMILPMFLGVTGILWSGPVADALAFILAVTLIGIEMKKFNQQEHDEETAKQAENG